MPPMTTTDRIWLGFLASAVLALALGAAVPARADGDSGLLLRGGEGPGAAAKLVSAAMATEVMGPLVRTRLRQVFRNDGAGAAEAVYLFPLPVDAAVSEMTIRIGARVIEGRIAERGRARAVYEAAREEGRRAGLVEQQRPNLFTTRFANVPAGETVSVALTFDQVARWTDGGYELSLPQVVTRRYMPPLAVAATGSDQAMWRALQERLADRAAIDIDGSTGTEAGAMRTGGHALDLMVRIDAAGPLETLSSPTHSIAVDAGATPAGPGRRYHVRFAQGPVVARRDVVLRWRPAAGSMPRAAVFAERRTDGVYLMGRVLPPHPEGPSAPESLPPRPSRPPRDVTFVLDTSGSMHGVAMGQAVLALQEALDALGPEDRFDLIRFAGDATRLFGRSRAATPAAKQAAMKALAGFEADGGTEMAPALAMALGDGSAPGALRQIIFLTDGAVGNEAELFELVARELGEARLFTIALGDAPNGWFVRKAAEFGRGESLRIADLDEAAARMRAFYRRIARPALTDLSLLTEGDVGPSYRYPARLPDLHEGAPLTFALKLARMPESLRLTGREGSRPVAIEVAAADFVAGTGVARYWARRRIESLMDRLPLGADPDAVRGAVTSVALTHGVMSRWTSFVAVETGPAIPRDADMEAGDRTNGGRVVQAVYSRRVSVGGPVTGLDLHRNILTGTALVAGGLLLLLLVRLSRRRSY